MRVLLAAVLLLGACSKAPSPAPGKARYEARDGAFTVDGPADWRVLEDQGGAHVVTFMGPGAVETIALYRYDKSPEFPDARSYAAAQSAAGHPAPPLERTVEGRPALELSVQRRSLAMHGRPSETLVVRTVLVQDDRGFWAIAHTAPLGKASKDVFDALVASFRPKR